ncbi:YbaB/EbfC family nucleoid-associated protein [Pseudohoeflea coraliihabitans]|uniref:Nucleoid-associated protein KY465_10770 n=1 Tax=Pseudohoeflea coraliihabitans TaxID=2860393 RepID=A0ABS6WP71_9HYPH|nr:YbaB/EbfC family nucleoid-associated protein [Pseudohoeflea sp. DP4N28-3]MBW3097762.1 YbaB/EbfC family nucleoid-associated protein [Pseudohoeflea sp. DP4N28-3]
MKDLMGMMGKLKDVQSKMQGLQGEIAELRAEGVAGGGLVRVGLAGKGDMQSLSIDPSLFKEDEVEILEDLILAAHNDARTRLEEAIAAKTQEVTAGLPIPPGMKLPF